MPERLASHFQLGDDGSLDNLIRRQRFSTNQGDILTRLFTGCFAVWLVLMAGTQTCCGWQVARLSPLEKFQRDLHRRVSRDQASRIAIIKYTQRANKKVPKDYQKKLNRLLKKASDIDGDNLAWLKKILPENDFPKASQIGKNSASELFLLIVHADRDRAFQKKCLDSMKQMPDEWGKSYVTRLEIRSTSPPPPTITQKDPATDSNTKTIGQKPTESKTELSRLKSDE